MRLTTMTSAAALALATAALIQVGAAPEEQKLASNEAVPDSTSEPPAPVSNAPEPAASAAPLPDERPTPVATATPR